ncbi:MAG: F0F1 ATP synthase subunit B [Gammaproteobacteria bacterium]|nr:F0F1 ATP synthase subunit B [Gammaproteobacteria bacterium]MDD9824399.1 F0F1 ATP synthase subunit B [Gammaproteobacteria bacterium]MDD9864106.1 F0F1 ATP synthase subunit B [Gammaproteobacteria bacterium]
MSINATLIGQMIVFALLIWFAMRFIWPVLLQAMAEREKRIADGLAAAEQGRRELEQATQRSNELQAEGRKKAAELIDQAQRRGDEMVEQAKRAAEAEGQRILAAAHAEVEQEKAQAREELRAKLAALVIAGAEQVLQREVSPKDHQKTLQGLKAELGPQ